MRCARQLRSLLKAPEHLGQLVEPGAQDVPIVKTRGASVSETYSERERFSSLTLDAKTPAPGMSILPEELSNGISNMTWQWPPQLLRQRVASLYHALHQGESHRPAFESIDVETQITGLFLQNFASLKSALLDIKKRRPDFVPQTILDIGFGPSTGLLAARDTFELPESARQVSVIIGHPRMKRRAKELLKTSNNVVFKDSVPSPNSPTKYDLIITTHQLYQSGPLSEEIVDTHAQQLAQQLAPGGILLFVERGTPVGFEAVALAREHLLRPKYGFDVVGPCQHTKKCPLQAGLATRQYAKTPGAQNWCRFSQNVQRPLYATELKKGQYLAQKWAPESTRGVGGKSLKGTGRPNTKATEVAHYSWVALMNSPPPAEPPQWPRIMKQPLKRQSHILMEVCAPSGNIEHWTVPRSQGKQDFHDARKAKEMDLWPLGSKSKQVRGGLTNIDKMKPQKPTQNQQKAATTDFWLNTNNPHRKHASHQARVHAENLGPPEENSFLPAMEELFAEDERRAIKIEGREVQKTYKS